MVVRSFGLSTGSQGSSPYIPKTAADHFCCTLVSKNYCFLILLLVLIRISNLLKGKWSLATPGHPTSESLSSWCPSKAELLRAMQPILPDKPRKTPARQVPHLQATTWDLWRTCSLVPNHLDLVGETNTGVLPTRFWSRPGLIDSFSQSIPKLN